MEKLILFVVLLVIGQIAARAKKSQVEARRRALMQRPEPRRAPVRPAPQQTREEEDEEEEDVEADESEDEEPARPVREPVKAWAPPPPLRQASPLALRQASPLALRQLVPISTLAPEPESRKAIRLSPQGLRNAIILTEIIGPPVALRDY